MTAMTVDDSPDTKSADQDSGTGKLSAESARYRTRLREVEQERDQLRERIDTMHRAQIETIAAQHLAVPGDLLDLGAVTLDQLRDDDGALDIGKVESAATALLKLRPGLGVVADELPPTFDGGMRTSPARSTGPTYQSILQGKVQSYDNLTPR